MTIHDTLAEARATGFRPCRRCRPETDLAAERAGLVEAACRAIEAAEEMPPVEALAAAAGLSGGAFHRLFKAGTGLTPGGYARARRAAAVREALPGAATVTAAALDAGYGSTRRFHAEGQAVLGMAPARAKAGGPGEVLRVTVGPSALGLVLVAESARGVACIQLGDDATALKAELARRFPKAALVDGGTAEQARLARVIAAVERPGTGLDLALDIRGTLFQQRVWEALRAIPAGETTSYAALADAIGSPGAVRAVAGACAANAHAVVIPCHRVVRSDGSLSGYRWGTERKRALLAREAAR